MPIGPYALDDFLDLVKSFHGSVAPFREANAKWLTNPAFDPVTLTAEYKRPVPFGSRSFSAAVIPCRYGRL